MREDDRRYAELLDAIPEAVIVHDGRTGVVRLANRAACTMFGVSSGAEVGRSGARFSAEDEGFTADRMGAALREAREHGHARLEWRSRRPDGSKFWSEVRLNAAELAGEPIIVAMVRNSTSSSAPSRRAPRASPATRCCSTTR